LLLLLLLLLHDFRSVRPRLLSSFHMLTRVVARRMPLVMHASTCPLQLVGTGQVLMGQASWATSYT
jgi:hypothetical protein